MLYEVITVSAERHSSSGCGVPCGTRKISDRRADAAFFSPEEAPEGGGGFAFAAVMSVITSYSIHYTKLYEKVLDITTTRLPDEDLELAGRLWHTMVFDPLDEEAALNIRVWIDRESGQLVQAIV